MTIKPRVRGFICVTAHPVGCEHHVSQQIDYVTAQGFYRAGSEAGAGNCRFDGVRPGSPHHRRVRLRRRHARHICLEHPGSSKKATLCRVVPFERLAAEHGRYAKDINGDAFSDAVKQCVIDLTKQDLGEVDLVIYSLAVPPRLRGNHGAYGASAVDERDLASSCS